MKLIDTHCHLTYKDDETDISGVLARAEAEGISGMVNICTTLDEADAVLACAQKHDAVYATVGIHPHDAEATLERVSPRELADWLRARSDAPEVIAIGETGLDYYYDNSPRDKQRAVFKTHLEIAKERDLPLSIHTRSARDDTLNMLAEIAPGVRGTIHCFSEDTEFARKALDLGMYISASGIATFKKSEAIRDALRIVPLERLLLETDSPFLSPVPLRGKRNEPAHMVHTARMLAALKNVSLADIARVTTENFYRLFDRAAARASSGADVT